MEGSLGAGGFGFGKVIHIGDDHAKWPLDSVTRIKMVCLPLSDGAVEFVVSSALWVSGSSWAMPVDVGFHFVKGPWAGRREISSGGTSVNLKFFAPSNDRRRSRAKLFCP